MFSLNYIEYTELPVVDYLKKKKKSLSLKEGKNPQTSDKAQEAKLLTEKIPFLYSHFYEKSHTPKVIHLTVSGSY